MRIQQGSQTQHPQTKINYFFTQHNKQKMKKIPLTVELKHQYREINLTIGMQEFGKENDTLCQRK